VKEKKKQQYRIRNWPEYNAALKRRGSLTLWVDEAALQGWHESQKSGRRGASFSYSASAILCALTLQCVYHLPLRATVGLLVSLFELMDVNLPVPDYSTLSRRRATLGVTLQSSVPVGPLHLLVDASGFKVFGEGEWKVRQHGYSKRRTWRKLHLGSNQATAEIVAAVVTTNNFRDDQVLADLLEQVPEQSVELESVSGDGIYDSSPSYELLQKRGARAIIPPRHGARLADLNKKPHLQERNQHIERLRALEKSGLDTQEARKIWKEEVNYHRRSLIETSFFRLKAIFGNALSARQFDSQANELFIRCATLNCMTQLGMPQSYPT